MAYDQATGERLRRAIGVRKGLTESGMFGGLTFLLNGNMCCGVAGEELVIRVEKERSVELASRKHARLCDITGRPMRGLVMVEHAGFRTSASLRKWVEEALTFTSTLPKKKVRKSERAYSAGRNVSR